MTDFEIHVADCRDMGMTQRQAEHDASLVTCRACDEPTHPVKADCDTCRGRGHVIGGDDVRPCPGCKLTTRSPFTVRAMSGSLIPKLLS